MPFGATSAAHTLAMNAQRHFHRYGTTGDAGLDRVEPAGERRTEPDRHLPLPDDHGRLPSARPITTPFGLYDCDVPCDAAIAVIVSLESRRDMPKPPVFVEAVGTQIIERLDWDQSTLTHEPPVLGQAAHLWTRTSLHLPTSTSPSSTTGSPSTACRGSRRWDSAGSARPKISLDGGKNIARDGQLPLNTHGGQLSHGRTHGMGLDEAVSQCAVRRAIARSPARASAWSAVVASLPAACSCCGADSVIAPSSRPPGGDRRRRPDVGVGRPTRAARRLQGRDRGHPRRRHHRDVFDCPGHPSLSLLRTGAARGFTVIALTGPATAAPLPIRRRRAGPNSGSTSHTEWWIGSSGNNRAAPDYS